MLCTIKYLRVYATTKCNANCWYCFNESQPFNCSTLEDVAGFKWLINQMVSDYGTEIIRFTGGEPLLNPHLNELIEIAKGTGVKKVGLTTNGLLLHNATDKFTKSGVDKFAVHLHQLDLQPANLLRIKSHMDTIRQKVPSVKFNIVVTKRNIAYVEKIVDFAIERNVNLLLLELLQAGNTDRDFEENFCKLESIRNILLNHGLIETVENINSKLYTKTNSTIKLVEHYADYSSRKSYCTRMLPLHPILLTPDFSFCACTHFGKKNFSVKDAVVKRDKNALQQGITELKSYLSQCQDCPACTVLQDNVT